MVEVSWSKKANKERIAVLVYGAENFGTKAAQKFNKRIEDYTNLLAERRREYRSLVVHEHYKLVYYIKEDTLYIVDL